ncbi:MAG: hypothetical protein RLZZ387_2732 [Chloroflexota bacterium]|jgi:CRP-like cAMP-binding protein/Fe-S-cluster-containing hydrogenase component 2
MGTHSDIRRREALARERADALLRQSDEVRRRQAAALAQLDCVQGVRFDHLMRLAELSTLRAFGPGAIIQSEQAPSTHLFLILRGSVSLALHDRAGHCSLIGVLNRGDCFGEGPLFGDQFRGATVQAESICYLLQTPLAEVRSLLEDATELTDVLRSLYRRRLVESTVARIPLFSQLSPVERLGITQLLEPARYARGSTIIREGEPGDALYMVESGQVLVEQDGQAIAHLDEGDFFGEMSLLTEQPHNADIRALTPVEILVLPAAQLRMLMYRQPALAAALDEVVEQRRAARSAFYSNTSRASEYAEVVARGLLRGRQVLARNSGLCKPGCTICEDACSSRHGRARLRVGTSSFNGIDIMESCRQCRVGAECVEVCPEQAIQWDSRCALVIGDACTGCGECVSACPHDAVQLTARDREPSSPLWLLWHQLKRSGRQMIAVEPIQIAQRADKCDLCHGYEDLACVTACPTGALRLVPIEELFPL